MRVLLARLLRKIGSIISEWWEDAPGMMICLVLGLIVGIGGAAYVHFAGSLLSIGIWLGLSLIWGVSVQWFALYDRNLMDKEIEKHKEELRRDGWNFRK